MREKNREGYNFSLEAKQKARDRAKGRCEFPGFFCEEPNTNQVNHLQGCFIAKHEKLDPRVISDPDLNAILLCEAHQDDLDQQERIQVEIMKELDKQPDGQVFSQIIWAKQNLEVAA